MNNFRMGCSDLKRLYGKLEFKQGGNNMASKRWKKIQIIQLVFFLCVSVFLFIRSVDGHGAVQTLEVKLISFVVWGIFYIGVLAIEWLTYFIVRRFKH